MNEMGGEIQKGKERGGNTAGLFRLSYSSVRQFCNCRRAWYWRYIRGLESCVKSDALTMGSAWHEMLEAHYSGLGHMSSDSHLLNAMFTGYRNKYTDREKGLFTVVATELPFEIMLRHSEKSRALRGVRFRGIIDMVVRKSNGELWLVEHKTAKTIDGRYISKLWHDLQIMLYAYAYQQSSLEKVTGIVYNVVKKAGVKQHAGETEAEYETRLSGLIAKSKTGNSSAKRKMPETDEAFRARLDEIYTGDEMYHREEILCDDVRLVEVQDELYELAREMMASKREGAFYKNRAQCQCYGECEFYAICTSGNNPTVIDNHYQQREGRGGKQ